ncbi:MAG: serine hydrolase [Chloroflexi bacterium]|uniref:Serine hydrolase n=1 Tax=Candidatus Chlorohelix allophototropha TaxID=3003348 RepID=A0A8T7M4Y0_9CHLR|nr:serine hydrolase [Chloroflexota bacterium]WJW69060.1 serine hydrolase [Chloroflexota bacterium L227-S17]
MSICLKCQNVIPPNDRFCSYCGTALFAHNTVAYSSGLSQTKVKGNGILLVILSITVISLGVVVVFLITQGNNFSSNPTSSFIARTTTNLLNAGATTTEVKPNVTTTAVEANKLALATTIAASGPIVTTMPTPSTTQDPAEIDNLGRVFGNLPKGANAIVLLPTGSSVTVNERVRVSSASLIKLWIAASMYEEDEADRLNLKDTYILKKSDQVSGTGIMNQATMVGTKFTYEDILYNMLVHSDNTAANLLIDKLGGFKKVNEFAKNNGYGETLLQRKLGIPDPNNENYTSAKDCAQFLHNLVDGNIVSKKASAQMMQILQSRATNGDNKQDNALNLFGVNLPTDTIYGHISGQNEMTQFVKTKIKAWLRSDTVLSIELIMLNS